METATPVLKFKYAKQREIDLGDGRSYTIPMKMKKLEVQGFETATPVFNLDKVFEVELFDETVYLPEKEEGMSDRMYEELCDDAHTEAREARKKNAVIRNRIQAFVKSGTLEIVDDPYARKPRATTDGAPAKSKPSKK